MGPDDFIALKPHLASGHRLPCGPQGIGFLDALIEVAIELQKIGGGGDIVHVPEGADRTS